MAGAIGAGDTGAVQNKRHAGFVKRDVHEHLVKGAVDERGIDGDHRVHTAVSESCRTCDGVLFGNSHIEHPLGILGCHPVKTRGPQHGSGNAHDFLVLTSDMQHFIAEDPSPRQRVGGFSVLSGEGVNLAHRVELVGLVVKCRLVTATLLGNDVNNDRSFARFGLTKRSLNILDVVAIDGTQVLDIKVRVEVIVVGKTRQEPTGSTTQPPEHSLSWGAKEAKEPLRGGFEDPIRALSADIAEEPGHAPNSWSIGATVVVDHDDEVALVVVGNIVERLPRHSASK